MQVFQRVVFQWRPEAGQAYFVNVFDRLHDLGNDALAVAGAPDAPAAAFDDAGKPGSRSSAEPPGGAWTPSRPSGSAYFGVVGDPIQANGLPVSDVTDMGNHFALRGQRVVFQQWKEDVPWAQRVRSPSPSGGDIAKEAGILPDPAALQPTCQGGRSSDQRGH